MIKKWSNSYKDKVLEPSKLSDKVLELKRSGHTIATLNGSFDLLHAGHLHMIYEAAQLGSILIVALNTDRSIQQYKSIHRPIIPLEYRLQMMAALGFVSYVTWFDETDPRTILEIIKPDVHVNGAEYGPNCIESNTVYANGGKVHIVELVPGLSTSEIVKTIIRLPPEG
jgi:D-glycero-beta-D-manno-heptose 1-phosphate adenylyltransferase